MRSEKQRKISNSQYRKIQNDYEKIKREFGTYLNGYIKAAKKERNEREPLYRESSLINFKEELGLIPKGKLLAEVKRKGQGEI